jgi:hypothetical protein
MRKPFGVAPGRLFSYIRPIGHTLTQKLMAKNCRDCDVRSLAGPEPDRQVFAKFKHLLRKAAARSAETICFTIREILRAFTPTECANYFRNSGNAQCIML